MTKVRFIRGFQGVATNEVFFDKGQVWDFDEDTAAQLVKEEAVVLVDKKAPPVVKKDVPADESQPAEPVVKSAPAKAKPKAK